VASIKYSVVFICILFSSCAAGIALSPSAMALQRVQLREESSLLPDEWVIEGHTHVGNLERLIVWTELQNIVYALAHLQRRRYHGLVKRSELVDWILIVDQDLPSNSQLYTLVHELAHIYAPKIKDVEMAETFAELTAVQVCEHIGLDTWWQTASYLYAKTSIDAQARTVMLYGPQIDRVVEKLSKAAEVGGKTKEKYHE
jgi:hypothetical protein